jgi:hypothetical protein
MNPTLPDKVTPPPASEAAAKGGTMIVRNPLMQVCHINISSTEDGYAKMRVLGERGWSTDVPPGGLLLPYELAETFDWRLIGGRYFEFDKTSDGETETTRAVEHQGEIYYQRSKPEEKRNGKKMPAKIWYSRGGKSTDSDEEKQSADDVIKNGYVALVTFKGKGFVNQAFRRPSKA